MDLNPGVKMTSRYLCSAFKCEKLQRKFSVRRKLRNWTFEHLCDQFLVVQKQIREAKAADRRFLFLDECVVSRNFNQTCAYSNRRNNVYVNENALTHKTYNCVAIISLEYGLEAFEATEGYMNGLKYVDALKQTLKFGGKQAFFRDLVSYHRG